MITKVKYSFDQAVKFFKKEWGEYQPLKYLLVDISLIVFGSSLVFIPQRGIEIAGSLLLFFGFLGICSPLLILLSSFYYFILIFVFPIKQESHNGSRKYSAKRASIENKIRELNKWKSVSEIPCFPFDSFQKLKDAVQGRKYTIGIDYSAATQFSSLLNNGLSAVIVMILAIIPWIALVIAIVFAIILKNYYLLFGIPIIGVTFALSNPLCPFKNLISFMGYTGTICLIIISSQTAIWLLSLFVITFWDVRIFYRRNTLMLRHAVMDSENLFMHSYGKNACTIKNNQTGEVYIYRQKAKGV